MVIVWTRETGYVYEKGHSDKMQAREQSLTAGQVGEGWDSGTEMSAEDTCHAVATMSPESHSCSWGHTHLTVNLSSEPVRVPWEADAHLEDTYGV